MQGHNHVYKGAPDVWKYLWKFMVIVWNKRIPRMWRQAGCIFIPKERNAVTIVQFRVEFEAVFLLWKERSCLVWLARRLVSYLKANRLIHIYVQKAGIPEFTGCLEYSNTIWHETQAARTDGRDLRVVFLDLTNAFGSMPHSRLRKRFSYFQVPEKISALAKAYFEDIQLYWNFGVNNDQFDGDSKVLRPAWR